MPASKILHGNLDSMITLSVTGRIWSGCSATFGKILWRGFMEKMMIERGRFETPCLPCLSRPLFILHEGMFVNGRLYKAKRMRTLPKEKGMCIVYVLFKASPPPPSPSNTPLPSGASALRSGTCCPQPPPLRLFRLPAQSDRSFPRRRRRSRGF